MNSLTLSTINWLHKTDIRAILERHGYCVYEHETTEELKHVLISDIESGEILESEII